MQERHPHRVAVLALDGSSPSNWAFPSGYSAGPIAPGGEQLYDVVTCSVRPPGPVSTDADFSILVENGPEALATADTVVVPASYELGPVFSEGRLTDELAAALALVRPGTRMVSICTGSYVLAAAGLLDDRPATTHWSSAAHFQRLFPRVRVDADVLYIDDGDVLTSAGVAAGIDLCLHIVRRDHGTAVANDVARRTVVPPYRDGRPGPVHRAPRPRTAGGDHLGCPRLGSRPARTSRSSCATWQNASGCPCGRSPGASARRPGSAPASGSCCSGSSGRGSCWSRRTCRSTRWRATPGSARRSR